MTDTNRPVLQPGPEHPIHISDQEIDVVVSAQSN